MIKIYVADKKTSEYTGMKEVEEISILNPNFTIEKDGKIVFYNNQERLSDRKEPHGVEDKYHLNRFQSLVAPNETGENEIQILNILSKEWTPEKDFRGTVYYEQDGTKKKIIKIGVEIPEGCLTEEGETIYHKTHDGQSWVEDSESKIKDENNAVVSNLTKIDIDSVRGIREMLVELFPEAQIVKDFLKTHEEKAKTERLKLKPLN